jgi:hypothetical protein
MNHVLANLVSKKATNRQTIELLGKPEHLITRYPLSADKPSKKRRFASPSWIRDVGAFPVSWETEPREGMRELFSFPFFADQLWVNRNRRLMHLLVFAAIIAQKDRNVLLNDLTGLQSRYTPNLLQGYTDVSLTKRYFHSLSRIRYGFAALLYLITPRVA